jgi:hypothetical protein
MIRSARHVATTGYFTGFGTGESQWRAIENAVVDAREQAERAGFADCAVGDEIVVGVLGPRCFFARVSYLGTEAGETQARLARNPGE